MKALRLLALLAVFSLCACEEAVPFHREEEGGGAVEGLTEIHLSVPLDQWNALLALYDANHGTKQYVSCDATYRDSEGSVTVKGAGLRLRGNTSRRRPENGSGDHVKDNADWAHCHFGLHFDKFSKNDAHRVRDVGKVNLKWFKDDATYVREVYCYDLFSRFGIWTAPHSSYCRLWIKVEGDSDEAYFGVYEKLEALDKHFLKERIDGFGSAEGNLWKCGYGSSLNSTNANFGWDDGSDSEFTYEYKGEEENYSGAEEQLKDFILKLTGKGEDSFYKWIQEVCDVELLLRTYAVNVVVGMWDDYWNNCNNYYLYFNSRDKYDYKFYFIPFDYDNTLGTSLGMDSGRQNPLEWGNNSNLLIWRLLKFDDFRQIYKDALLELVDPDKGLFYYTASMQRIKLWQDAVRDYLANDTGEDCEIADRPASWGNQSGYRIMSEGADNFFQVKTETINKYCK